MTGRQGQKRKGHDEAYLHGANEAGNVRHVVCGHVGRHVLHARVVSLGRTERRWQFER